MITKSSDWDAISSEYCTIKDTSRDAVFATIHERLKALRPECLLDYGCGDGTFAASCSNLPISQIVAYDPASSMSAFASKTCLPYPQIKVEINVGLLPSKSFDVITFNAVWMCLPTEYSCLTTLHDINHLLKPGGQLVASVTHPCFRDFSFSTYSTKFKMQDYLNDGTRFPVTLREGSKEINFVDTHWSLSAMSAQLKQNGFVISEIIELPDRTTDHTIACGGSWMILFCCKVSDPDS